MAKYEVWDEVDQPEDINIIGCRWVFWIKRDSDSQVLKYRARGQEVIRGILKAKCIKSYDQR